MTPEQRLARLKTEATTRASGCADYEDSPEQLAERAEIMEWAKRLQATAILAAVDDD